MNEYIEYLDKTIIELQKEENELIQTNRKDEANFIRIKRNMCDICKTVYNVHAKQKSGDELKEIYITQLTKLADNWKMSLEKAEKFGDTQKVLIEEIKLEMMEMIKKKFEEIGE